MSQAGSTRIYWVCQFIGWGFFAALSMHDRLAPNAPLSRVITQPITLMLLGVGISHTVLRFMQRRKWFALSARALVARGIGAVCAMSLVGSACSTAIGLGVYGDRPEHLGQILIAIPFYFIVLFFGWMTTYFAMAFFQQHHESAMRSLRLEKALQAAELRSLKSQLNPHFLFNSMNSICALIAEDPQRARDAVTGLSRTLRYTLHAHQEELVQLERELEIVDDYLALESLRLGERLTVARSISQNANKARIPPMLLQTLVENAIKHGIARLPAGGELRVSADVVDGTLLVQVENPRPKVAAPSSDKAGGAGGVGLANSSERLRLLFGAAASLELELSERAVLRLRIPQKASGGESPCTVAPAAGSSRFEK